MNLPLGRLMSKTRKKRSNSFRRTRSDHATETAEDYVEAIAEVSESAGQCRAADLARLFDVSHVTVSKTISRLSSEGLVETKPYGPLELTPQGKRLAETSKARHELVLQFLLAIGVSEETAEIDAEGIEHHVSMETLKRFQAVIDDRMPRK